MKLTMKNLLLGLGSIGVVAAPVVALVACTDDEPTIDTTVPVDLTGTLNGKASAHPVWQPLFKGVKAGTVFEVTVSGTKLSHKVTDAEATEINKFANNDQAAFVSHVINLLTDASHDFDAVKTAFGSFAGFSAHGVIAKPVAQIAAPQGGNNQQQTTGGNTQQPTTGANTGTTQQAAQTVTIAKDLSQGSMGIWHAVTGGSGTAQIANGTIIGFKDGSTTYSVAFDKAKFDALKTASKASVSYQAKDFFFAISAAVAGSWDHDAIKTTVASHEAIIKSTFTTVWTAAKGAGTHSHMTTSAQADFDALKADLNGTVVAQTQQVAAATLPAGTLNVLGGSAVWHGIGDGHENVTPWADGVKLGIVHNGQVYETAPYAKDSFNKLAGYGTHFGNFKISTAIAKKQEKDFFIVSIMLSGAKDWSVDEFKAAAADATKAALAKSIYKEIWDSAHAGNPTHTKQTTADAAFDAIMTGLGTSTFTA